MNMLSPRTPLAAALLTAVCFAVSVSARLELRPSCPVLPENCCNDYGAETDAGREMFISIINPRLKAIAESGRNIGLKLLPNTILIIGILSVVASLAFVYRFLRLWFSGRALLAYVEKCKAATQPPNGKCSNTTIQKVAKVEKDDVVRPYDLLCMGHGMLNVSAMLISGAVVMYYVLVLGAFPTEKAGNLCGTCALEVKDTYRKQDFVTVFPVQLVTVEEQCYATCTDIMCRGSVYETPINVDKEKDIIRIPNGRGEMFVFVDGGNALYLTPAVWRPLHLFGGQVIFLCSVLCVNGICTVILKRNRRTRLRYMVPFVVHKAVPRNVPQS